MKPKLVIKGSQDIVDITINQGKSVDRDLFYKSSNLRAVFKRGDEEVDVTTKFLQVDLSELTDIRHSGNYIVPWKLIYDNRLLQEGEIQCRITVEEVRPVITDYKIKDDGYQILLNKGVSLPKGYNNLPDLHWTIEYPGYSIESLSVFFVNNKNNIMEVDYGSEFDVVYGDGVYKALYTGGLINFDGVARVGVAYILTLTSDDEIDVDYDESIESIKEDSFTNIEEEESKVNQFLNDMVGKLTSFKSDVKEKVKSDKKPKEKVKPSTPDKKSKPNKVASIILTVAMTVLIGFGTIFGVNKYKEVTLNSIQDEVTIIETNQDQAYNILNKQTLSDEDIRQLDKLLNQNQQMINSMNSSNIFIAQKRNDLAEYNNSLVSEAKTKFDNQIN